MKFKLLIAGIFMLMLAVSAQAQLLEDWLLTKSEVRFSFIDRLPRYKKMTVNVDESEYDSLTGKLLLKGDMFCFTNIVSNDTLIEYYFVKKPEIRRTVIFNKDSTPHILISKSLERHYFYKKGLCVSDITTDDGQFSDATRYRYRNRHLLQIIVADSSGRDIGVRCKLRWHCGRIRSEWIWKTGKFVPYWEYEYSNHGRAIYAHCNTRNESCYYKLNSNEKLDMIFRYTGSKCSSVALYEYYPNGLPKSFTMYKDGKRVKTFNYTYDL